MAVKRSQTLKSHRQQHKCSYPQIQIGDNMVKIIYSTPSSGEYRNRLEIGRISKKKKYFTPNAKLKQLDNIILKAELDWYKKKYGTS